VIAPLAHRLWTSTGAAARLARSALRPLGAVYGGAVAARSALYDRGFLAAHELALPAVAVGNLTVGGTGKTPVAAWLVRELAARRAAPAVVLRDYGADEALVHAALNPTALVVTGADRVDAVRRARSLGADVAVLDDAFQHRRAQREADLVLLSADAWRASRALLPAGPWREPLSALRRADLVLVTRKVVTPDVANDVWEAVGGQAGEVPRAVARLAPTELIAASASERRPLSSLRGADVVAVAGIADPDAFRGQLEALGASVRFHAFGDHHAYTRSDAARLARAADGAHVLVCTLKDAVKLAPLWPANGPGLWYLSQGVILERGRAEMERLVGDLLDARARYSPTAG
jgi:tetraacyldisaccharide 4'-kinase